MCYNNKKSEENGSDSRFCLDMTIKPEGAFFMKAQKIDKLAPAQESQPKKVPRVMHISCEFPAIM